MGRKRAALQRQNGLRVCCDAYSAASAVASALADPRGDADDTAVSVVPLCAQLLGMISSDAVLAHFVAQGFPNLIHRLLPHAVASCAQVNCDEASAEAPQGEQPPAVLLLCTLLIRCGAPMSEVGAAVEKQVDALVRTAVHANSTVASLALVVLRSAVSDCEQAASVATRLLEQGSVLWEILSVAEVSLTQPAAETEHSRLPVAGLVHLVRLCVASAEAGSTLESSCAVHVVAWLRTLPLLSSVLSPSEQSSLTDAALLLVATLRMALPDMADAISEAMTENGLGAELDVDEPSHAPLTSRAIAVTLCRQAGEAGSAVDDMCRCVQELSRRDFDAEKRLASVERLGSVYTSMAHREGKLYAAAALYYVPGAVQALFGAMCDVEVSTSECACRVLADILKPAGADEDEEEEEPTCVSDRIPPVFFQNGVAEQLVRLGCILTLEDVLGDYNADVVTAALSLTTSLLLQLPQVRAAVVASLCLQRLGELLHTVAEKEDVQEYLSNECHQQQFASAFGVLLALSTSELATLPEDIVADVGTVTTFCRGDLGVLKLGLTALAHLAAAHPYAATLVVDYDFVTEQLQAPDEPQGAEQCLVVGTLNIMTAVAARVPSAVSLEWIELLLLCFNRLQIWEASAAFKLAAWACLEQTLVVSEESREYMFEEDLASWLVKALAAETDARVVMAMLRTAMFVPTEMEGLLNVLWKDVVEAHCLAGALVVVDVPAPPRAIQQVLLNAVELLCHRVDELRAAPELFDCICAITGSAMKWPEWVLQLTGALGHCCVVFWEELVPAIDAYVRRALSVEGSGDTEDTAITTSVADGAAEPSVAVVFLEALGAAAATSLSTCSGESRRRCARLAEDIVGTTSVVPIKASLAALFLLLHALSAPESPELAASLLGGRFFDSVRDLGAGCGDDDLRRDSAALEAQSCEALYQTVARLVQALPYEKQQALQSEAKFVSFLESRALRDVRRSFSCGDLLMQLLSNDGVRHHFTQSSPEAYRDALEAMEAQRGEGPLHFVFQNYKAELQ